MKRGLAAVWAMVGAGLATGGGAGGWALGQTHVVKRPESVVRAVAVYEWTGEEGKATASRLVPVTVFINGHLEDGGIYLARPVPFALDTGTVFEVEKAGAPAGTLVLAYARHYVLHGVTNGTAAADDGWQGFGAFKPVPKEPVEAAKKSGPLPEVVASGGNRPHFSNGAGAARAGDPASGSTGDAKPVDRSGAAGGGTTVSAENDPDRPTMRRRDGAAEDGKASGDGASAAPDAKADKDADAGDGVERPTLKRRTPVEEKAAQKKKETASVTGVEALNDDPDRPNLHRGKPAVRMDEEDLPPLKGLPKEMHQAVAVSDAKDRPDHEFARVWESADERAEVLRAMEEVARGKLAGYDVKAASGGVDAAGGMAAAPAKTGAGKTVARPAVRGRVKPAAVVAQVTLMEEGLRGYTLSYGGAATFVYTATSAGVGGAERYVAVVAQREPLGTLKVALTSVTDSTHLDRTPWMRLVDVVDAEASNRASLLFELRGQGSRQFGLYRVIGAAAEQTFVTAGAQ